MLYRRLTILRQGGRGGISRDWNHRDLWHLIGQCLVGGQRDDVFTSVYVTASDVNPDVIVSDVSVNDW